MGFYFLEIILYTNISLSDWGMICGFKNQKISHLNLSLSPSNHQNCSIWLRGLDDVSCTRGFHDWCSCITFISFGQEGSSPPIEFIREDCLRNLSRNDLVTPPPPTLLLSLWSLPINIVPVAMGLQVGKPCHHPRRFLPVSRASVCSSHPIASTGTFKPQSTLLFSPRISLSSQTTALISFRMD